MLSNVYLLGKFCLDTAENEPTKKLQILQKKTIAQISKRIANSSPPARSTSPPVQAKEAKEGFWHTRSNTHAAESEMFVTKSATFQRFLNKKLSIENGAKECIVHISARVARYSNGVLYLYTLATFLQSYFLFSIVPFFSIFFSNRS